MRVILGNRLDMLGKLAGRVEFEGLYERRMSDV